MIRGIVFDLFDTLVDQNHRLLLPVEVDGRRVGATTPALHACASQDFGLDLPVSAFVDRLREVDRALRVDTIELGIELSTRDRFAALGDVLGIVDRVGFADALTHVHMSRLEEAASTPVHHEAVLTALAVDYRLAICSNFSHAATARSILAASGLVDPFSSIVISEEAGIRKPRPEIFLRVAEEVGLAPREILHVGDNLDADVRGAAEVGMKTLWLTRQIKDPERAMAEYDGPRPDFSLEDLRDIPVLMARLGGPAA